MKLLTSLKPDTLPARLITLLLVLMLLAYPLPGGTVVLAAPGGRIWLKYATFDPLQGEPAPEPTIDPSISTSTAVDSGKLFIVQFNGPVESTWRSALETAGASVIGYIPDHAYLVRMESKTRADINKLSFVRWIGNYRPSYKLAPELIQMLHQKSGNSTQVRLSILLRPGADSAAAAARLSSLTGVQVYASQTSLLLETGLKSLNALASDDDILWIEPWHQMQIQNKDAAWVVQSGTPGSYPVWANGITGAGPAPRSDGTIGTEQIIAIADTGIDMQHPDFQGPAIPNATIYGIHNFGDQATGTDCQGHGTHVAGTAAGSGAASGGEVPYNNGSYKGVAFGARIYFQQLCSQAGEIGYLYTTDPTPFTTLMQNAYNAGARIHSDSWGDSSVNYYDSWAQAADSFIWNHPDFLVAVAAGNAYNPSAIESPATAKNVIAVGATGNGTDQNSRAAFTSQGPVSPGNDGRIKPDIMSPGVSIVSACAAIVSYSCTPSFPYVQDSGTSMATPGLAGAAALVRDWYQHRKSVASPSSALIKATLLISSRYLSSLSDSLPSNAQGWGRVTLADALYPPASSQLSWQDVANAGGLSTNQIQEYDYYVSSPSQPLRFMITWTDPPAQISAAKALVNDLDLEVIAPNGTIYHGNDFNGAYSVANGIYDRQNNTEGVFLQMPAAGLYRVRIHGQEVAQGPQGYALVVLGTASAATDLLFQPSTVTLLNDGTITPTVTANLILTNNGGYPIDWQTSLNSGIPGLSLQGPASGTVPAHSRIAVQLVLDLRQTPVGTSLSSLTITTPASETLTPQHSIQIKSIYTGPNIKLKRQYITQSLHNGTPGGW